MRFVRLILLTVAAPTVLALSPSSAQAATEKFLDSQQIAALETRAAQAAPKEQCFLYAELAHSMAEIAGQQLNAGDERDAAESIRAVQRYADKIHMNVADDARKLKNAEILMRQTAFRLKAIMLDASLDDRPSLESTLKQLDKVESEMMLQVFRH
ncbi:hypothetical protein [Silvibacterium dinghuense]|uniref:Uncharacterized protein n=1 Tax=Silvibacterium dinghuense TaxID=1560006 RepID=A0A4Q1SDF4_9BACT|nr:hypothetical protein [Silvibacterium dinghuense]RXS95254.1 hypothetical protein ESZ00_11700 [Silvibacterium dinghuense]GGH11869.1 hypothetical protein GCM10011586_30820 [Silvibacterium dinghuense]